MKLDKILIFLAFNISVIASAQTEAPEIKGYISISLLKSDSLALFFKFPKPVLNDSISLPDDSFEVLIVMGTWCEDSQREVPVFLNLIEVSGWKCPLRILAVDKSKMSDVSGYNNLNIKYVPTFIFYYKGEEIGRIVESPQKSMKEDIQTIISKVLKK
jgi:thiol-disulfide isomerase/thioredoxin